MQQGFIKTKPRRILSLQDHKLAVTTTELRNIKPINESAPHSEVMFDRLESTNTIKKKQ